MNNSSLANILLAGTVALALAGCTILKPSGIAPRSFVLTPAATVPAEPGHSSMEVVGMGFVKLPGYLLNRSMAMRRGTSEIIYLESAIWAERLDSGFQRVVASNLSTLLPETQVRVSTWRPEEVSAAVYITVDQFDTDDHGQCVLKAWWRILSPNGETWKTGQIDASRQGLSPITDPAATAGTLSELAAELSRDLVLALESTAP